MATRSTAAEGVTSETRIIPVMTLVTRSYLVDDLDGSDEDVSTILLALDKVNYEIDLSAANEAQLGEKLERFVDAATPVKAQVPAVRNQGRKQAKSAPVGKDQAQAVRDWARNQGLTVSERGRISKSVQEAFEAAH